MELIAMLLLLPIGWAALSWRYAGRARQSRIPGIAVIAALALVGWVVFHALSPGPTMRTSYAQGDKALRLLLE